MRTRVAVFTYVSGFVALVGITVMLKSFTQGLPYFITTPSRAGLENGEREWGKLVIFFFSFFSPSFLFLVSPYVRWSPGKAVVLLVSTYPLSQCRSLASRGDNTPLSALVVTYFSFRSCIPCNRSV